MTMFVANSVIKPEQEARKLVKAELATGGRLRRWKSKLHLQPHDSDAIVAALARQGDMQGSATLISALLGLLKSSGTSDAEVTRHLDSLLPKLISNNGLRLFTESSACFSVSALTSALHTAIQSESPDTVEVLLQLGADFTALTADELAKVINYDVPTIHSVRLDRQLRWVVFGALCDIALDRDHHALLRRLLRDTMSEEKTDVSGPPQQSFRVLDRDVLLQNVIRSHKYSMLQIVIDAMPGWTLDNSAVLLDGVIETANEPEDVQQSVIMQLLTMVLNPSTIEDQDYLNNAFIHCIEYHRYDTLFLMLQRGLRLSAEASKLVCRSTNPALLDRIWMYKIGFSVDIWEHISSLPVLEAAEVREKVVLYMIRNQTGLPSLQTLVDHLIEANQADLLERLVQEGVCSLNDNTDLLARAIKCRSVRIVSLFLNADIDEICLEKGLLATENLTTETRSLYTRQILRVMSTRFKADFVEHTFLRLLCSVNVQYDQETAKHLLEFVKQKMSVTNDSRLALLQVSNLEAVSRCKNDLSIILTGTGEQCVLPDDEDYTLQIHDISSEERILALLKQHIVACSQMAKAHGPWSTTISQFLLAWLATDSIRSKVMTDCIVTAIYHAQLEAFKLLLAYCQMTPIDLAALPSSQIILNPAYIDSITEYLDRHRVTMENRIQLYEQWYRCACTDSNLKSALHISHLCQNKMQARPALQCLKGEFDNGHNLDVARAFLSSTILLQEDLEDLWDYAIASRSPLLKEQICMLLQLGYRGSHIYSAIIQQATPCADIPLLQAILENRQVEESSIQHSYFDYDNNAPVLYSSQTSGEVQYRSALSGLLQSAIRLHNVELCELALRYDAPMLLGATSVLTEAVRSGPRTSLGEDRVLTCLLNKEIHRNNSQAVYDYVLLQAVESLRDELVHDMLDMDASPQAYGSQTWKIAMLSGYEPILQALICRESVYTALQANFGSLIACLFEQRDNIDKVCSSLSSLHKAGFAEYDCYDQTLSLLCELRQLSCTRITYLERCGVSIRSDNAIYLKLATLHDGPQVFYAMLGICADKGALTTCFADLTDIVVNEKTGEYPSAVSAMQYLATLDMPQYAVDSTFQQIMLMPLIHAELIPILIQLVQKGAYIGHDGESLARCYLTSNDQLITAALASTPSASIRENALQLLLTTSNQQYRRAFSKVRSVTCRIGIPHSSFQHLIGFILYTWETLPHGVIDDLFKMIKINSSLQTCDMNCRQEIEDLLLTVISNLEREPVFMPSRLANLATSIQYLRQEDSCWNCSIPGYVEQTCCLNDDAITSLLLVACEKGLVDLVVDLLALGADPNSIDAAGQTALCIAAKENHDAIVELLNVHGARVDDGSLHIAFCAGHQITTALLLNLGHSPLHESCLFGGVTVLKAFMETEHETLTYHRLESTVTNLLLWMYQALEFDAIARELINIWKAALQNQRAHELMNILSDMIGTFNEPLVLLQSAEFDVGDLRYSASSLIKEWEGAKLTEHERLDLSQAFELHGFNPMIYAEEGDQPGNAINIPAQYHQWHAFRTKDCAVCGDKAKSENDIFAGLIDACAPLHGWNEDVICSDCLAEYLQTKMFPHDDEVLKFNFPSAAVPCWAPQCQGTMLSHDDLRRLVDKDLFLDYDEALCQQMVNSEKSFVKCATTRCPGGIWCDEDTNKEEIKVFFCEMCYGNTCIECNAMESTHNEGPCPASAEAKKDERLKEEERLSEATMQLQKRCPRCQLKYEKISGCDHITCGINTYARNGGKGCGHHFCHVCYGDWHNGHHASCAYGAR